MKNFRMFLWMTLLTGVLYPALITVIGESFFQEKARGSFIKQGDIIVGSRLIGQSFSSDQYFWPRPSAISYNPLPSGGSNLGPISSELKKQVEARGKTIKENLSKIPSELLFASGSGLDPHISVEAASFQIERIAKARNLALESEKKVLDDLIKENTTFSYFGPPYVNVLSLNIALDKLESKAQKHNGS